MIFFIFFLTNVSCWSPFSWKSRVLWKKKFPSTLNPEMDLNFFDCKTQNLLYYVCLSVCLCLSVCVSVYLSVNLSVCLSMAFSILILISVSLVRDCLRIYSNRLLKTAVRLFKWNEESGQGPESLAPLSRAHRKLRQMLLHWCTVL